MWTSPTPQAVAKAIEEHKGHDLTLSGLTQSMGQNSDKPIDAKWLRWVTQLMEKTEAPEVAVHRW